jgi:HSP20 family protein
MSEKSNPFKELDELIERMNREFSELSRSFEGSSGILAEISVDIADTGEDLVVTADLPGCTENDIDLRTDRNSVTIGANADRETVEEDVHYHRRERHHGSVSRRIPLPEEVDAEAAMASCTNGVLTVKLPKRDVDAVGGHEIDVQ